MRLPTSAPLLARARDTMTPNEGRRKACESEPRNTFPTSGMVKRTIATSASALQGSPFRSPRQHCGQLASRSPNDPVRNARNLLPRVQVRVRLDDQADQSQRRSENNSLAACGRVRIRPVSTSPHGSPREL